MQQHVRYIVIEDDPDWSRLLTAELRQYFEGQCRLHKARVLDDSAYDGDQGRKRLANSTYDLASLDMNLGSGATKSKISGLDLLGDIAEGNRVFFVIIVTGAVNDPDLENVYGKDAAALMRYGAMNEAIKKLPAERVRILHKPAAASAGDAMKELAPHLRSALDQYRVVSRERNIFRPLPGNAKLWEVRYDGGRRLTIPASFTFELIRNALAQPNREMKVIQLIQTISQGYGGRLERGAPDSGGLFDGDSFEDDSDGALGDATGIDWEDIETEGLQTPDHCPVDTIEGTIDLEVLIGALLLARRQRLPLKPVIDGFLKQYGVGPMLRIPAKIRDYASRPQRAEQLFRTEDARAQLKSLLTVLTPAFAKLREQYHDQKSRLAKQPTVKRKKSGKTRVATGIDTKEMILARQHWQRARKYLTRHSDLASFVEHIEDCVERGLTAKGHIHYVPTRDNEFAPFWLTD